MKARARVTTRAEGGGQWRGAGRGGRVTQYLRATHGDTRAATLHQGSATADAAIVCYCMSR